VQSQELIDALSVVDSDIDRTKAAWLLYVQRRKDEFWKNWDETYGFTAIKRFCFRQAYRIWNSKLVLRMRRNALRLKAIYFPEATDGEVDDSGMNAIELAEEAHRLRLKELLEEEEEAQLLASASANKAKARSDREDYKRLKEEYEKTGDKGFGFRCRVSV